MICYFGREFTNILKVAIFDSADLQSNKFRIVDDPSGKQPRRWQDARYLVRYAGG